MENIKVEGLSELQAELRKLPSAVSKSIMEQALRDAAKPLASAMRAGVPKDSGRLSESIAISGQLSARQASMHRAVDRNDVEIFVGPGPLPYAHIVEFGSKHQQARPYVRPAWDAGKGGLLETIKESMTEAVMKRGGRG
jgi:HK97 gp10 family phage protein